MANFANAAAARHPESYLVVQVGGSSDVTLTVDQTGFKNLELQGALTGNINLNLTLSSGTDKGLLWDLFNNTSGSFTVTVRPTGNSGVAVTQGKRATLAYDGTNIVAWNSDPTAFGAAKSGANADITSLSAISAGITAAGGMNLSGQLKGNLSVLQLGHGPMSVAGSSNVTLTSGQYAFPHLEFTGALTGNIQCIVPLTDGGLFFVYNNTTGAFSLTVIGASGTGISVPQGKRQILGCDGTNVFGWSAAL